MRTRLISMATAGAVTVLALGSAGSAQAGGTSGPLCSVLTSPTWLYREANYSSPIWLVYPPEKFRRHEAHGGGWAYGHSESSYPTDYWVRSSDINCH